MAAGTGALEAKSRAMAAKTESGDRWERSNGYVYFIGVGDPPTAIKVGISTQRMVEAAKREAELHARFATLQRFRKGWAGSEWFTASPELIELVSLTAPCLR